VVPLSQPFVDRYGVKRREFRQVNPTSFQHCIPRPDIRHTRLRKGDVVVIPILAIHRLKSLWGEDADEFK
jgi:hypothetical protein